MNIDVPWPNVGERWVLTQMEGVAHDAHSAEPTTVDLPPARWLGKFSLGESIPVLRTERRGVIKLCIVVNGMTSWHDTVELWLFRSVHLIPPSASLHAEIYTFSTLVYRDGNPTCSFKHGPQDVEIRRDERTVRLGRTVFTFS